MGLPRIHVRGVAPFFLFLFSGSGRTPFLGGVPSGMVQITLEKLSQGAWKILNLIPDIFFNQ